MFRTSAAVVVSASAIVLCFFGALSGSATGAVTIPHVALHTVKPHTISPPPVNPSPQNAPPVGSGCPRTGCPGYPPPTEGGPEGGGTWRPPGNGGGTPDPGEPGPVDPGRPSPGHELDHELTEVRARGPLLCSAYGELAALYMSIGEALEALGNPSAADYFYELSGEFTRLALGEPQSLQSRVCITTQDR